MKYSKTLIFSGIGCVAVLLLIIGVRLQAQNTMKKEIIIAKANEITTQMAPLKVQFRNRQEGVNWRTQIRSENAESNNSDFYKVIVDNNLFRPLGWRPPKKEPEYAFIGTRISSTGSLSEAYVLEQRSNQFYIAKVGDKVGDATVKEIKEKKITLDKNGETITLRGGNMQFLNSGGARRSSSSRSESANRNESNNKGGSSKSFDKEAATSKSFDKEAAMRKAKEEAMKKMQDMRLKFSKGIPPENRDQIIRQLKERGVFKGNSKVIVTFD